MLRQKNTTQARYILIPPTPKGGYDTLNLGIFFIAHIVILYSSNPISIVITIFNIIFNIPKSKNNPINPPPNSNIMSVTSCIFSKIVSNPIVLKIFETMFSIGFIINSDSFKSIVIKICFPPFF